MNIESNENSKNLFLGGTSLLLGCLYVFLFFEKSIGLNYPLFLTLVITAGLFLSHIFLKKLNRERYVIWL